MIGATAILRGPSTWGAVAMRRSETRPAARILERAATGRLRRDGAGSRATRLRFRGRRRPMAPTPSRRWPTWPSRPKPSAWAPASASSPLGHQRRWQWQQCLDHLQGRFILGLGVSEPQVWRAGTAAPSPNPSRTRVRIDYPQGPRTKGRSPTTARTTCPTRARAPGDWARP